MLNAEQVNEIHRLYHGERWSLRKIERHLHLARKTIRKYLHSPMPAPARRQRTSKLDAFKSVVASLLEQEPSASAVVLLQRLRSLGYEGGVTILRYYLRQLRANLAPHFRDVRIYRLESPECVRYKQVVVFGIRRNRRERECLQDADIARARLQYASLARHAPQLSALPREADAQYHVPPGQPVQLVSRGLPLDQIEDLLPHSPAYRQAGRILFAETKSTVGQPLTPLHAGHTALLAVSGLLNGIFGSGESRHIAFWQAVKVVDKTTEEDEKGVITIREKERFSSELTLVFATGEVATRK